MNKTLLHASAHPIWIYVFFTVGAVALFTGCDTGALTPTPQKAKDGAPQSMTMVHTETMQQSSASSSYACFTSIYDPSEPVPYQYGHLDLAFSDYILAAAGGETLQYDYRLYDDEGQLHRLANCIIPDADAART